MASSPTTGQPLSDERSMLPVSETPSLYNPLIDNFPNLVENLNPSGHFWLEIARHKVLSKGQIDLVQAEKGREAQVSKLLDFLIRIPASSYHKFILCLYVTNQATLIRDLGLKPENYAKAAPRVSSGLLTCPLCQQFLSKAYHTPCCGAMICNTCYQKEKEERTCTICDTNVSRESIYQLDEEFAKLSLTYSKEVLAESVPKCASCRQFADLIIHKCENCQHLCSTCLVNHQKIYSTHKLTHEHQYMLCCIHAHATKEFCQTCHLYCCLDCSSNRCHGHKREQFSYGGKGKQAKALLDRINEMKKNDEEVQGSMSDYERKLEELSKYTESSCDERKKAVQQWKQKNLAFINDTKRKLEEGSDFYDAWRMLSQLNELKASDTIPSCILSKYSENR